MKGLAKYGQYVDRSIYRAEEIRALQLSSETGNQSNVQKNKPKPTRKARSCGGEKKKRKEMAWRVKTVHFPCLTEVSQRGL